MAAKEPHTKEPPRVATANPERSNPVFTVAIRGLMKICTLLFRFLDTVTFTQMSST